VGEEGFDDAPYFEILQSTVEDHAGTVVKFTGWTTKAHMP